MNGKPAIIERQALGNLLDVLSQVGSQEWKNFIKIYFDDWEPIQGSQISPSQYYSTLVSFPKNAKRLICEGIIIGWNVHHDLSTLYHGIISLIYLKICDTTTFFFLQEFYNFLSYFKDVCESIEQIIVESRANGYCVRFLKPNQYSIYGDSYGLIDFQLSNTMQKPLLAIVPYKGLLVKKSDLPKDESFDNEDDSSIMETLYPVLNKEFIKKHCPWIVSNWDFQYDFSNKERFVIIMHSLRYCDNNGY